MKHQLIIAPLAVLLLACHDTPSATRATDATKAVEARHIPEAAFSEPFRDLIGVVALGDSAIMVADVDRVYLMSLPDQRVRKVAEQGDGAGEFRQIGWIQAMLPDTIAVYDSRQARITLLSPTLTVQRTIPLNDIIGGSVVRPYCMLANGHALIGKSARPSRATEGEVRNLSALVEYSFDGAAPRALASTTENILWVGAFAQNGYTMSMAADVPFAPSASVRCQGDHAYWLDGAESRRAIIRSRP